ncbi:unnamed protein product [Cuscuta epithymum]|uniref:Uncharacterized protein n=1 Tax=Cuscuta epithymum TaxID=186058 RepID=A0AAV0DW64_9ASTE|nr:unnamed protein product [Cuscuta epithymum]
MTGIYVWLCWPQTLGGLINIAYNSSSGLSSDSNHNNHSNNSLRSDNGSESFSSHSTVEGEWLEVLTDNGHLHIDRILPLLPPAPPEFPHFYKQCVECAIKALMHYNKKHKQRPRLLPLLPANPLWSSSMLSCKQSAF